MPKFLQILASWDFQWKGYKDLAAILPVLLDPHPDAPKVYTLDTEFYRLESGQIRVTEVAFVNVKTGRIAVNAVLDEQRIPDATTKLRGFLRAQQQDPALQHIPTVYNATGMAKQIEDCQLKESDMFVEFSTYYNLLDLPHVRSVLKQQEGYDESRLIPSNHGYAVTTAIRKFLSQALPLLSGSLHEGPDAVEPCSDDSAADLTCYGSMSTRDWLSPRVVTDIRPPSGC